MLLRKIFQQIDALESELLRLQAERDELLDSPQTARRARLTEASKMEVHISLRFLFFRFHERRWQGWPGV